MLAVDITHRSGDFRLSASFAAGPGVTAVFGPSGAGKTTLLSLIAGALRPDAGRIVLGDEVWSDTASAAYLPMESRGVGWVFQDARLFPHMSIRDNLQYGARRSLGRKRVAELDDVVSVLALSGLLGRRPSGLSGGERQRVALGRALLTQPRLLLMDEPLAALDHARRLEAMPYLARLTEAFSIPTLYVTHSLSEVVRLADRIVVLDAGAVAAAGPVWEVAQSCPLINRRSDAAVRLDGVLAGVSQGYSLVRTAAGDLITAPMEAALGSSVRLVVLARDVMLATGERPANLSARNVLPAHITAMTGLGDGVVSVRLVLGRGAVLLSNVTQDAVQALSLDVGKAVYAVIKSAAVEGARPEGLMDLMDD